MTHGSADAATTASDAVSDSDLRQLVLSYLTHHCCREAALAFARETGQEDGFSTHAMDARKSTAFVC